MEHIEINVESIQVKSNKKNIKVLLENPDMSFLKDISFSKLIKYIDKEKLLEYIIESDTKILHTYLFKKHYLYDRKV